MSASEKLKALDAAATPGVWEIDTSAEELDIVIRGEHAVGTHYWHLAGPMTMGEDAAREVKNRALTDAALIASLRNALPQIVAVVQQAEREHPEPHNYWEILDDEGSETRTCPVCAALSALEEALT